MKDEEDRCCVAVQRIRLHIFSSDLLHKERKSTYMEALRCRAAQLTLSLSCNSKSCKYGAKQIVLPCDAIIPATIPAMYNKIDIIRPDINKIQFLLIKKHSS
jgi:hypothetical protein